MKRKLLIFCMLLFGSLLTGQSDDPVVVISAKGKIQYLSPGTSKPVKVLAGAALKPNGMIKVGKNAKVILLCEGQFAVASTPGQHELSKLCAKKSQQLGFQYELGKYMLASVELAAYAESQGLSWIKAVTGPKSSGDGWASGVPESKGTSGWGSGVPESKGTSGWGKRNSSGWSSGVPESKGTSGWGASDSKIRLVMPADKLLATKTTFFWSNQSRSRNFLFQITDEAGAVVYNTDLRDSFLVLDLSTLKMTPGVAYSWHVSVPGNNSIDAQALKISIGTADELNAVLQKAGKITVWKTDEEKTLHQLAEAVALEKAGWFYAAYEAYQKMPKDNLTRMMHTAFWARYHFEPMAEKAAMK